MSKCPVCGRTGLVGKEHEIVGNRAVTVYKCHGCDNSWRVPDNDVAVAPAAADARAHPAPRKPAARARRATSTRPPPRIVILSVGRAEKYQPHGAEVCISITDPKAPPVRVSSAFKAVLRLSFTDIASPSDVAWHVHFAPEHAQAILDFVEQWPDVDAVVIHCVGGLSRSPAVAMALCELRGWPLGRLEDDYPLWNTWVRSELVKIGARKPRRKPASSTKKS
jgi:hypothetical protein